MYFSCAKTFQELSKWYFIAKYDFYRSNNTTHYNNVQTVLLKYVNLLLIIFWEIWMFGGFPELIVYKMLKQLIFALC